MGAWARHRVRLTVDLTRYDWRCKVGEEGWTNPNDHSGWSTYDRFTKVKFDNGAYLDVLWESLEVLEKDVPVDVPHPSMEPENTALLSDLIDLWNRERSQLETLLEAIPEDATDQVMFSHPAAGPIDPVRALRLAHAHLDTHRRQIERLRAEIGAG